MFNPFNKKSENPDIIEFSGNEEFALTLTRDEFANLAVFLGSASTSVLELYNIEDVAAEVWEGFEASGLADSTQNDIQGNLVYVPWIVSDHMKGVVW